LLIGRCADYVKVSFSIQTWWLKFGKHGMLPS
jgi:hypothetical protein